MRNLIAYLFVLLVLSLLFSCKKNNEELQDSLFDNGTIILCEGNYNWNNASVSIITTKKDTAENYVFQKANGYSAGDVLQSGTIVSDTVYLVANNSGLIRKIQLPSFKEIGLIDGFNSPRFMQIVSEQKAYVSDLFANKIWIVNIQKDSIIGSIQVSGWCEEMLLHNNNLFVTNKGANKILVINTETNTIITEVNELNSPGSLAIDKNGIIWVLCGGWFKTGNNYLAKINTHTIELEQKIYLPKENGSPMKLRINATKDTLYYSDNDIYRFSIYNNSIDSIPFISSGNKNFYGLGIEPESGNIFVADAKDYTQNGEVYQYSTNGNLIKTYSVGRIPNYFLFKN